MSTTDKQIPSYVRFVIAGLAGGSASFASHPFDLVKYRMQLSGKGGVERTHISTLHALHHVMTKEGIFAIYTGLSASIIRQLTLTMIRLGMYSAVTDKLTAADGTPPSMTIQMITGIASGAIGAIIGNPTDVILVRMSSDGALPPDEKYNYKNVFDAMRRMYKEEGLGAMWIGWKPAAYRCMLLNLTQIVLYKNTKVKLLETELFEDNTTLHVVCSLWTAIAASVATAPIDIVKTRLMVMKADMGEKSDYGSIIGASKNIIKHEGFFALWKGITPTFARILPNNFMIFIVLEILTRNYKRIVLGDTSGSGF